MDEINASNHGHLKIANQNVTMLLFVSLLIRKYLNIDTEAEIGRKDINVELHDGYCYTK